MNSLELNLASRFVKKCSEATDDVERNGLIDCAFREDAIAEFIELVEPQAESRTSSLKKLFPDMQALYDSVMAGQDRSEQLRRQAAIAWSLCRTKHLLKLGD